MKRISDFIKELEAFQVRCGDLPVLMNPESSPGQTYFAGAGLAVVDQIDMASDEEPGITDGTMACFIVAGGGEIGDPVAQVLAGQRRYIQQIKDDTVNLS